MYINLLLRSLCEVNVLSVAIAIDFTAFQSQKKKALKTFLEAENGSYKSRIYTALAPTVPLETHDSFHYYLNKAMSLLIKSVAVAYCAVILNLSID